MDAGRWGEKVGWIGGWIGASLWMPLLAGGLALKQGPGWVVGLLGLFSLAALVATFRLAPWRHPDVPMWRLMLPGYGLLLGGATLLLATHKGLSTRQVLTLLPTVLPLLMPLLFIGRRRWRDGCPRG